MSYVTNVILMCSSAEEKVGSLDALNEWLVGKGYATDKALVCVESMAGGHKCMESLVAIGAFSYLDLPAFMDQARSIKWRFPGGVQFAIKDETWDEFRLYGLQDEVTELNG